MPARRRLAAVFVAGLLVAPLSAADAAAPTKGAEYLDVLEMPVEDSRDDTLRLKVSSTGRRLNLIGPHERCGGFNPVDGVTYPVINRIRIKDGGKFRKSREYEVIEGSVTFFWTVKVRGRFETKKRAKGTIEWQMKTGGERSQGVVVPCGGLESAKFVAVRGADYPGLKAPPH
jgi:hypothetical protein